MSNASVKTILRDIEALGDKDRLALEQALAKKLQSQWKTETAIARKTARRRGITQATIDRAIERRRYGR